MNNECELFTCVIRMYFVVNEMFSMKTMHDVTHAVLGHRYCHCYRQRSGTWHKKKCNLELTEKQLK